MRQILSILILALLPATAWAGKVALVIGNADYVSVSALDNPENDARAVSRALSQQGFDVIAANDLTRATMRQTIRNFRQMADSADVALVYYAGHGIEIGGTNYLVPVDARLDDERDADLEMIELDLVLDQISGAKALKMVVLDACRNNPFVVKMQREGATRSVRSGLGRIEYAGADTLVAYAAAAGEITPDGAPGANSPFTAAFIRALSGPPTDVRRLLGRVRDNMRESVPGAAPFVYTSLGGGEFVINPNSTATAQPTPAPAPETGLSISEDFVRIDRTGTYSDWNDFLVRHEDQSDHPLYAFALEKREALRAASGDAHVAALDPVIAAPRTEEPPKTEEPRTLIPVPQMTDEEARRRFQVLLKERGCYSGAIDGILGRGSQRGMTGFEGEAGVAFPIGALEGGDPLLRAISLIEGKPGIECPAPKIVRSTPQPKPEAQRTTRTAPVAAPAPKPVQKRASDDVSNGGVTPRRTKLLPEKGSEQIECFGNRKKFYDCD